MNSRQFFFVNRFYWPDEPATAQLLTDLAEALATRGFRIVVIARQRDSGVSRHEARHGVEIERIPATRLGKASLMGRVVDFTTFLLGARRVLARRLRAGDVVVAMTDPPLLGVALAGVARRRRAALVHWVQDIFPEVAAAVSGKKLPRVLYRWRNEAWRSARHCVVPGEDMAEFINELGVPPDRITVSPNWAPAGLVRGDSSAWRQRHGLEGRFVVMYSGNLGRVHDFRGVISLARRLIDVPQIQLVFIGQGARRSVLEQEVSNAKLSNVRFLDAEPRETLGAMLSAADLHLVTLRQGCETLVFPSKLYGIAAVETPVLYLGPIAAEIARTIAAHGLGAALSSEATEEAADFILSLADSTAEQEKFREAARAFHRQSGGLDRASATWESVLAPLIQLAPRRSDPDTGLPR